MCDRDVPGVPGAKSCAGDYSTSNLNNYIYSQNSGIGPSYSNGCVKVTSLKDGKPLQLIGDGQYHNYTILWHTGDGGSKSPGWTEFYVDGIYLGATMPSSRLGARDFLWRIGIHQGRKTQYGMGDLMIGAVVCQGMAKCTARPQKFPRSV